MERRLTPASFEVRTNETGQRTIVGYAARFNELSVELPSFAGSFREKLAPGAFRAVLGTDVRALWNHNPSFVLGRTTNGTLRLEEDEFGLRFEIDPPDSMLAASFLSNIERGDVSQMSFGFSVGKEGQAWDRSVKPNIRTVTAVSELSDVSPVTYPAYPTTAVGLRSFIGDDPSAEETTSPPPSPTPAEEEIAPAPSIDTVEAMRTDVLARLAALQEELGKEIESIRQAPVESEEERAAVLQEQAEVRNRADRILEAWRKYYGPG